MSRFVHLHLHTQYSVLDGAIKIAKLVERVSKLGQQAVGITDHGTMHGVLEFYSAAKEAKIKPILGCEAYITSGSRFDKSSKQKDGPKTHHITLLAANQQGYRNLCRLVTAGFTQGYYFKPRIDFELLSELNEGLIVLSGCMSSELASYTTAERHEAAAALVEKYVNVFDDRYYLEIQPHELATQRLHNEVIRDVGLKLGVPLVATNDCHYLDADDAYAQEVLMCISTQKLITDPTRMRHEGCCLHVKTEEEMLREIPEYNEAVKNTFEIAERCNVEFDFSKHYMPRFEPTDNRTLEQLFMDEARRGLESRFQEFQAVETSNFDPADTEKYRERLEREISLILTMGFAGYFLVVSDFIRWAKDNGIPVGPGRGSAAGSLVAYAMNITDVDPIPYDLLFERFLNPDRVSLPDIDIDFCIYGRSRVIDYVCQKYGKEKVAQIATFGTLKAKAALKDVGRVLGYTYAETDRVAKLVPAPRQGFDYPLEEALKMEKRLRDYAETEEGQRLISLALKLEGLSRHTSTHAAGVVIADRPCEELMPLMVDKEGQVVTQLSMSWVEKIGLVKFDFLGLKTLTVLDSAVRMIRDQEGVDIQLNYLPLNDPLTFQLISQGRTTGVFQLESSGITDMVTRLKPSCFEDLVAILALYRPGPLDAGMVDHYINRKHGREPTRYMHPILEPILKDTYGIILYQEQIMQIARDMAGYSLAEADMLRRAMGKKKPEEMAKHRHKFIDGAKERGVAEKLGTDVFDQMETFARYGFNKSHSVAYALISFQTAYLKAHYPKYFMAALMTLEMSDTDRTLKNISECREMGLEVSPPNVNSGAVGFSVHDGKILFGLAAIKGIGEKVVDVIIEERKKDGPFVDFYSFCERCGSGVLNKRTLENLIRSGAFDWTGITRAALFEKIDHVVAAVQRSRELRDSNQIDLFGGLTENAQPVINYGDLSEWPTTVRLGYEKEALGFYLSGHPLEKFSAELQRFGAAEISELYAKTQEGADVSVAGVVTMLKLKNTKKGERYASFTLEDMRGRVEVLVWPSTYLKFVDVLASEDPVLVSGRLDISEERRVVMANSIESVLALRDKKASEALIRISEEQCPPHRLGDLKQLLAKFKGECTVRLIVRKRDRTETVLILPPEVRVSASETLSNSVERLFGAPVMTFR